MEVHPTVTASTMIAHVSGAAQGQMSHTGLWRSLGHRDVLHVDCAGASQGEASDFRLTAPSSRLVLSHESNTQGGSLGGSLVCFGSPQLRCHAPLASSLGEIASASMVGSE